MSLHRYAQVYARHGGGVVDVVVGDAVVVVVGPHAVWVCEHDDDGAPDGVGHVHPVAQPVDRDHDPAELTYRHRLLQFPGDGMPAGVVRRGRHGLCVVPLGDPGPSGV